MFSEPFFSPEAERAALGAMMLRKDVSASVRATVNPDHFFNPAHKIVAETAASMAERGIAVDLVTMVAELETLGKIKQAGGRDYIVQLCEECVSTHNADDYARIVREHWQVRESRRLTLELAEKLNTGNTEERIEQASMAMDALDEVLNECGRFEPYQLGTSSLENIVAGTGIPTPWPKVNSKVLAQYGGLPTPGLMVINAYRGVGKTMLALQMAIDAARQGYPVLILSLEMTRDQIERRVMKMLTGSEELPAIDDIFDDQDDKWKAIRSEFAKLPFEIMDPESATIQDLQRAMRAWHRKHRRGMIIVDYLQLIEHADKRLRGYEKTEAIAKQMGDIARSLVGSVVVACSQVSVAADGKTRSRGGPEWETPAHLVMVLEVDEKREEYESVNIETGYRYYRITITKVRFGRGEGTSMFVKRSDDFLRYVENSPRPEEMDAIYGGRKR